MNVDNKQKFAFGITSQTKDKKHVIFVDFDNIAYTDVVNTLFDM